MLQRVQYYGSKLRSFSFYLLASIVILWSCEGVFAIIILYFGRIFWSVPWILHVWIPRHFPEVEEWRPDQDSASSRKTVSLLLRLKHEKWLIWYDLCRHRMQRGDKCLGANVGSGPLYVVECLPGEEHEHEHELQVHL